WWPRRNPSAACRGEGRGRSRRPGRPGARSCAGGGSRSARRNRAGPPGSREGPGWPGPHRRAFPRWWEPPFPRACRGPWVAAEPRESDLPGQWAPGEDDEAPARILSARRPSPCRIGRLVAARPVAFSPFARAALLGFLCLHLDGDRLVLRQVELRANLVAGLDLGEAGLLP